MEKLFFITLLFIFFLTIYSIDKTIKQEIKNRESWLEHLEENATIYRDIRKRLQKTENRISQEKSEINILKWILD